MHEYYSYSYSVKILIPNIIRICIRSKKQYSLTSDYGYDDEDDYAEFDDDDIDDVVVDDSITIWL